MIVEYVRYRLNSEPEAFEAAYARAAASLAASPHCLDWELGRCHEQPECYILRLCWDSLDGHLEGFRRSEEFRAFLAEIRPYIDEIEEMRHYTPTAVRRRTLCDALGGPAAIFSMAHAIHEAMAADDLLGPRFSRAAATHVPHLGMWLCEVFGGPALYTATLGDIGPMLARHANLNITEAERERFVSVAVATIGRLAPSLPESATAAITSYFEWGSGIAVVNSEAGHVPDPSAGVPVWEWAGDGFTPS